MVTGIESQVEKPTGRKKRVGENSWESEDPIRKAYRRSFDLAGGISAEELSPLVLAYLGDGIYDLAVREYVIRHFPGSINHMNSIKKKLVCAAAQSEIMGYLIGKERLSEEEMNLYRRGRNQKSVSHSKNSSIQDYRRATGFEALLGYLYLKGELERMIELSSEGVLHLLTQEGSAVQEENNER